MIWHRDRITVAELLEAQAISFQCRCVSGWRICLHPFEKRWADVEAHSCIEIVAMLNFPIGTEHSRLSHRRVAFTVDPLIPVMERRSARLRVYLSGPGIFARRLVEVAMHDNGSTHLLRQALSESRMFGNTASRTSSSFASSLAFARSPLLPSRPRINRAQSEM